MAGHVPPIEMTPASFDGIQPARYSALGMGAPIQSSENTDVILRRVVAGIKREGENTVCRFNDGSSVHLANRLAALVRPGDEITFPLAIDPSGARTEIYIRNTASAGGDLGLYQAPISYVGQPKADKRGRLCVRVEVSTGGLGISSIHLPCTVVRDYFYTSARGEPWIHPPSFYDVLRITPSASLAELRLAFSLRQLELRAGGASKRDHATLERAFNILAQPELRSCYDSLLKDSAAPTLFPYGGFGSILVAGNRSRDGVTFFATQILTFLPEHRERRFHAPMHGFDFHNDRAIYRDARRKVEVTLDQSALPITWDATWNQWKYLLGAKVELKGTFVETGKYRHRRGEWQLVKWETALPSRIAVKVPANLTGQVEAARNRYHRFGEFSDALANIRARIEREPVERKQLRSICWDLGIPGDFDVARINWRPDYDPFFYQQLSQRARQIYLFRDEYIFDLPGGVAVEKPQLGHATYLFSKPSNMEVFLAVYAKSPKGDIRKNRSNVAEKLGFLGRTVHTSDSRVWLTNLESFLADGSRSESGI